MIFMTFSLENHIKGDVSEILDSQCNPRIQSIDDFQDFSPQMAKIEIKKFSEFILFMESLMGECWSFRSQMGSMIDTDEGEIEVRVKSRSG